MRRDAQQSGTAEQDLYARNIWTDQYGQQHFQCARCRTNLTKEKLHRTDRFDFDKDGNHRFYSGEDQYWFVCQACFDFDPIQACRTIRYENELLGGLKEECESWLDAWQASLARLELVQQQAHEAKITLDRYSAAHKAQQAAVDERVIILRYPELHRPE